MTDIPKLLDGSGFNQLVRARHGYFLYNRNDVYIGRSLETYGEYSEGEVRLFRQVLKPGDVVVEAGSNIGAHTVPIAKIVGPQGTVHAFEPQPIVFQTLCANVALNSLFNVRCHNMALGESGGELRMPPISYEQPNNFGGIGLDANASGTPVPVARLDDALKLDRLKLLKADVEGMELQLIRGGAGTIQRLRPLLYVENDREDKSPLLLRTLGQLGYRLYWDFPALFDPQNFAGRGDDVFGRIVSSNVFGVPQELDLRITNMIEVTDDQFHPLHSLKTAKR